MSQEWFAEPRSRLVLGSPPPVLMAVWNLPVDQLAYGPNFTPNMYQYNLAFQNQQFDYSAAIAFTLAIVTMFLVMVVLLVNAWHAKRSA